MGRRASSRRVKAHGTYEIKETAEDANFTTQAIQAWRQESTADPRGRSSPALHRRLVWEAANA